MAEERYKGLLGDLAKEIQMYENSYFIEDSPIPFKNFYLYPATVRDYEKFAVCSMCLTLNKNDSPANLRKTHLEFFLEQTQKPGKEGEQWQYRLQLLCAVCFHIPYGLYCLDCGEIIPYDSDKFRKWYKEVREAQEKKEKVPHILCEKCGKENFVETIKIEKDQQTNKLKLFLLGQELLPSDFTRLRQILLFQNFSDYQDDSWVDPDLKADHEKKLELERKGSNAAATLEEKIVCLAISTHFDFQQIYSMSIRKFTMCLSRVDELINYKIAKTALSSGFASLDKGKTIEHWIYHSWKDMYGEYKSLDQALEEVNRLG